MKKFLFIVLFSYWGSSFAQIEDTNLEAIVCAEQKSASQIMAFKTNANTLNYDVTYHKLEFTVDPAVNFISGKVTTTYKAISNLDTVVFDLSNALQVSTVKKNGVNLSFTQNATNELEILLPTTQLAGSFATIEIVYSGTPVGSGFGSFIQSTHAAMPILWTLSEPFGARDWWPCKQDLSDKVDSIDVFITAPSQYVSVSNGIEPSAPVVNGTEKTTHFAHKYPIPAYLIAIAVTNYSVVNQVAGIAPNQYPVINYMYPENLLANQPKLNQTPLILALFDSLLIPYPFAQEKYGHAQFGWGGGMEHTTVSFMVNFDRGLIAHEMAHQWFGDDITCGSWQDIWLNESFATYMASLVIENFDGESAFITDKVAMINYITSVPDGAVFVPTSQANNVNRLFNGRLTYYKGAMVLNMLRLKLGDSAFFQGLKNYLNDMNLKYGYAITADFKGHMEAVYGQSLTEFFNDWIFNEGFPTYNITAYNNGPGVAHVSIIQSQSHSSVSFFEMPVPIRFLGAGGLVFDTILENTFNGETFNVNLPFAITGIVFDPKKDIISLNDMAGLGIETNVLEKEISIFPIPATDVLTIKGGLRFQFRKATIYTQLGQNVGEFYEPSFPVSQLATGIYLLKIESETGVVYKKFVKM